MNLLLLCLLLPFVTSCMRPVERKRLGACKLPAENRLFCEIPSTEIGRPLEHATPLVIDIANEQQWQVAHSLGIGATVYVHNQGKINIYTEHLQKDDPGGFMIPAGDKAVIFSGTLAELAQITGFSIEGPEGSAAAIEVILEFNPESVKESIEVSVRTNPSQITGK